MKYNLLVLSLALFLIPLVSAAGTYTVFGTGDTNFNVPEGEKVISNSIVIENPAIGCDVELNNNGQEDCSSITSFNNSDFRNYWSFFGTWRGDNSIDFDSSIDNFTLIYTTENIYGGEGDYCNDDNQCSLGSSCFFGECCSHNTNDDPPIYFTSPITKSCPDSSIPIASWLNCGTRDRYAPVEIDFYLNGVKIDESGVHCNVTGGSGWDLDGERRCGTIGIPLGVGAYDLTARYTISGHNFDVTIDPSFDVEASCGTNVTCGHAGSAQLVGDALQTVSYNPPSASVGEVKYDTIDSIYAVVPGSTLYVTGISSLNAQCSNGVSYGIRQGFVTWSSLGTFDSLVSCDISGVVRDAVVGDSPSVWTVGFKPPVCDLALTQTQGTQVKVGTFANPGTYNVKMDMVNAICDTPDYICPDLTSNNPNRAVICKVGTMGPMTDWRRADGWRPLEDYNFIVVSPNISYQETLRDQDNDILTIEYNITNTGIGRVNIPSVFFASIDDFSSNCTNCPSGGINEGGTRQIVVNIKPQYVESTIITNSITPTEYNLITLNDYNSFSFKTNKIVLNYLSPLNIEYDDDYSLTTLAPSSKQDSLIFSMDFECNASDRKYALNLTDRIFYCFCENKGFCENVKGENNAPCACIDEPEKNKVMNGTEAEFNATRSFNDLTPSENLSFNWFYDVKNESFYNETGMLGAIFTKQFPIPGEYKVRLEVKDLDGLIGIDKSRFFLTFSKSTCIKENSKAYWLIFNETTGEETEMPSENSCYRDEGWPSTTCCPESNECNLNNPGSSEFGKCTGASAPQTCSDYNAERYGNVVLAESYCKGFNIEVAERSMELFTGIDGFCDSVDSKVIGGKTCWRFIHDCRCVWNGSICEQQASYSDWTCEGSTTISNSENCTVSSTLTSQREEQCETTGYMTYGWKALWTGEDADKPEWCEDKERKLKCAVKLPFFTIASLIVAVILIIVIYVWTKKRKIRKSKKRNKK